MIESLESWNSAEGANSELTLFTCPVWIMVSALVFTLVKLIELILNIMFMLKKTEMAEINGKRYFNVLAQFYMRKSLVSRIKPWRIFEKSFDFFAWIRELGVELNG